MDFNELVNMILRAHRKDSDGDQKITRFFSKVKKGTATYGDVLDYAGRSGEMLALQIIRKLSEQYPNGIPPDVLDGVLPIVLTDECNRVLDASGSVQQAINRRAKVNLAPVDVGVDTDRIYGLVEHFKDAGLGDASALISNLARSEVDETAKRNAEFQDSSGLEVTVSRYYDDVGVNHGKDECQWCLDRCGENVPYKEAYQMGMFQRHPGCGCTIEYHTSKGTKRQADWTKNSWIDTSETLNNRKTNGL